MPDVIPGPNFGLTPELIAHVKQQERWVPHAYICPAGYPTIGYGHRIPQMSKDVLTIEQGTDLLMRDLRIYRDSALRLSPSLVNASQRRVAAIVDFLFNCGPTNYSGSHLREAVQAFEWKLAATENKKWVYATDKRIGKKVKLAGLIARRGVTSIWLEQG